MELIFSFISSVIVGITTLIGVIITNNKSQAITQTKLENLTREVRELSNNASQVPVLKEKIHNLEEKINNLSSRIYAVEHERFE